MVVGGIFIFLALGHILYQKRSSASMISWMLSIILLPYIAVPLYFFIGIRKRQVGSDKRYIDLNRMETYSQYEVKIPEYPLWQLLEKNGIPPPTTGNTFELITKSSVAYERILSEIKNAKQSIDICTYVFEFDVMTATLLEALTKRAQEGVRVRLLIDIVGSLSASFQKRRFAPLELAGGEVVFFRPFTLRPFKNYINLRNHRKIYLFDQKHLFSGGMNLSNEYIGKEDGSERQKDLLYFITGPAVHDFYTIFHNDWIYATGEEIEMDFSEAKIHKGTDIIQVIPSGPDLSGDAFYESLLDLICSAKTRIWIVTPYFVPNDTMMEALIIAGNKGIDVKLITPKKSDHLLADVARSSYMRDLKEAGIDVILYEGKMLHAKTILFDSNVGMVGSANFDNRSLFLNYEVVSFVYSTHLTQSLESWMKHLIEQSTRDLGKPSKVREAAENIMKVFAAIL